MASAAVASVELLACVVGGVLGFISWGEFWSAVVLFVFWGGHTGDCGGQVRRG